MEYVEMNASVVKAFMIEKKSAVDDIENICKVQGVDMIQFGPSDYCMSIVATPQSTKKSGKQLRSTVLKLHLLTAFARE